jgi:hypothetical protein
MHDYHDPIITVPALFILRIHRSVDQFIVPSIEIIGKILCQFQCKAVPFCLPVYSGDSVQNYIQNICGISVEHLLDSLDRYSEPAGLSCQLFTQWSGNLVQELEPRIGQLIHDRLDTRSIAALQCVGDGLG